MADGDRLLDGSFRQLLCCRAADAGARHKMQGTRPARPSPGQFAGKRSDEGPCRAGTSADPMRGL